MNLGFVCLSEKNNGVNDRDSTMNRDNKSHLRAPSLPNNGLNRLVIDSSIKYHEKKTNTIDYHNDVILPLGTESFYSSICQKPSYPLTSSLELETTSLSFCLTYYPSLDVQNHLEFGEELTDWEDLLLEKLLLVDDDEQKEQTQDQPYPIDHMDSTIRKIHLSSISHEREMTLFARNTNYGIITRRGYKGGDEEIQTNQDRASIITPFITPQYLETLTPTQTKIQRKNIPISNNNFLIGIWDGHNNDGHVVAYFVQKTLPLILSSTLVSKSRELARTLRENELESPIYDLEIKRQRQFIDNHIQKSLMDSFLQVDASISNKESGCTSSVVLGIGTRLYFANTGDSQIFLASFTVSQPRTFNGGDAVPVAADAAITTKQQQIHFITRCDKPDLPEERERIEKMGGVVKKPLTSDDSSRVNGLAMSRSFGDIDVRIAGVIPDPTVTVIDLSQIVNEQKTKRKNDKKYGNEDEKEIYVIVAASDGLLGKITPEEIIKTLADVYSQNDDAAAFSVASGRLVMEASKKWLETNKSYRDDITIAVQPVEVPNELQWT